MDCWTPALSSNILCYIRRKQPPSSTLKTINSNLLSQQVHKRRTKHGNGWSFLGGSRVKCQPNLQNLPQRRSYRVSAMCNLFFHCLSLFLNSCHATSFLVLLDNSWESAMFGQECGYLQSSHNDSL